MSDIHLDSIDRKILDILQNNARTPNAEIARKVNMAPSAVLERVRKLERRGVILGYHARIDPKPLDMGLTAFTFVRTEETPGSVASGEMLAKLPEVMEVHHTAGHDCYMVKLRVADTQALGKLLIEFGRIDTVRDTRTTIVLTTVKESTSLPLEPVDKDR